MKIGIGLPATIPGTSGATVREWARRADAGPFSSIAIIDRLVYGNYEPLVTLAAVAGVTTRVRLMTTVLVAPLRNAGILAKQAASLDALCDGRLTLGLGVGAREDDFLAAPADFRTRGRRFEKQLETMYSIWSDDSVAGFPAIGPPPTCSGGPEVLIGGYAPAAIKRLALHGDGFISGGGGPEIAEPAYRIARQAWSEGERAGEPRFVACAYFGLGENGRERGGAYIRDYYSFLGPVAEGIAASIATTPDSIRGMLSAFEALDTDEFILWPTIADLDQVDLLAEVVA